MMAFHTERLEPFRLKRCLLVAGLFASVSFPGAARELAVGDFCFDGPLGSQGATIERLGPNHFKIVLGHAPGHDDWPNNLQFAITGNAKGNRLVLDTFFFGGKAYRFNQYHYSWSYDRKHWQPIAWQKDVKDPSQGDRMEFPEFTEDTVYLGHQVPMAYEEIVEMMETWSKHPHAKVHVLGKSLGGRNLYRLSITDPRSPHPARARWGHYCANQHPGEHNAQWRMVGMIQWLLSDAGADCRQRSISHFVLTSSPDGPTNGWYRVASQGVDMNRAYLGEGADPQKQPHEAYLLQRDVESLMASDCPITDYWSMHTWAGIVEPLLQPGPEMGGALGPWTDLAERIKGNDPQGLIKPLKVRQFAKPGAEDTTHCSIGIHKQFGITTVLCEGAGGFYTQQENLDSGTVLMRALAEYYRGTRP